MTTDFLKKAKLKLKKSTEISETEIEDAFCDYAKSVGCTPLKLILLNLRGFPDRTVLCPGGRILFIEFKKKGGELTPGQKPWKRTIEGLGFQYFICDEIGQAEKILQDFLF